MPNKPTDWTAVAAAVKARIDELRVSQAELVRASGVSDPTWRNLLKGNPLKRPDVIRQVCVGLGWTVDSIDRILAGEPPVLAGDITAQVMDELRGLTARVAGIEVRVRSLEAEQTGHRPGGGAQ